MIPTAAQESCAQTSAFNSKLDRIFHKPSRASSNISIRKEAADLGRFQLTFTRGSWELPSGHMIAGRQVLSIPSISATRLLLNGARVCRDLPGWEKHI